MKVLIKFDVKEKKYSFRQPMSKVYRVFITGEYSFRTYNDQPYDKRHKISIKSISRRLWMVHLVGATTLDVE